MILTRVIACTAAFLLTLTAGHAATMSIDPLPGDLGFDFGSVELGQTASQSFQISVDTSQSTATKYYFNAPEIGISDDFSRPTNTCTGMLTSIPTSSPNCTFSVLFSPSAVGEVFEQYSLAVSIFDDFGNILDIGNNTLVVRGTGVQPTSQPTIDPVPLPASLPLALAGMVGLAGLRLRRKHPPQP